MNEERFIEEHFIDEVTGLDFGLDVQGRYYLHALHESRWANTTEFQTIRCSLTGDPTPMVYEIPPDKTFQVDSIIAVTDAKAISLVGVYIDDEIDSFFPVGEEMYYSFNEKMKLQGKLEFKFKPYNRKTKLSIFVHGLLL
jgi:hypothetical protein